LGIEIIKWWFIAVLLGLLAFPVNFIIFRKSNDRGYIFSKITAIFLVSYFSWLFGFIHFSTATVLLVILILAGLSAWAYIKNKEEISVFFANNVILVFITEILFLAVFVLYARFRMYQPDIVGTEKFMDFAFMNSIARADKMPPYDPWMYGNGLHISYYYFGYLMMAIMFKLTGVMHAVGYNLALSYTVSLAALGVFGILYNLTKNYLAGLLGIAFLLIVGNLDGFLQFIKGVAPDQLNWWTSSRIIDHPGYDVTINEFPYFSFLLGDLHPHQMAIPFVLLALNTAFGLLKTDEDRLFEARAYKIIPLFFTGLLLGGLWFLNSWDLPTYFFITVLCIAAYKYSRFDNMAEWWKDAAISVGIIFGVAVIMYLPFTLFFGSQAKGIGIVKVNTRISDFLVIFGILLFPVISFVVARSLNWAGAINSAAKAKKSKDMCPKCGKELREGKVICGNCGYMVSGAELKLGGDEINTKKTNPFTAAFFRFLSNPSRKPEKSIIIFLSAAAGAAIALLIFKTLFDGKGVGLFSALMLMALSYLAVMGISRSEQKENQFVITLIFTAFLMLWGCELFHIIDSFSRPGSHEPLERMNTVFKFYYQAWIMLSIAAAYGFFWTRSYYLRNKPVWAEITWVSVMVLLIILGLFYTVNAFITKTQYNNSFTLDGSDFLRTRVYEGKAPAAYDYEAIQWLNENVKGHPVILEAWGGEYTEYARITSFTGLPTVIGWPGHEYQWRGTGDEAARRQGVVDTIYNTQNIMEAQALLEQYGVTYVYAGPLERLKYPGADLAKFGQFMDIVFTKGDVTIYRKR